VRRLLSTATYTRDVSRASRVNMSVGITPTATVVRETDATHLILL